jgi:DNA mismatch repair ATPase MutS
MVTAWLVGASPLLWLVPVVVQVLVNGSAREETTRTFLAVSSTQGAFLKYSPLLELLEQIDVRAELISDLKNRMHRTDQRPSVSMRRFQRALGWFELRHNGLVHPFVNAVLMWDVHCVLALEAWQASAGREARGWFLALGELEALSSFAGLAHDEPDFAWPSVEPGPPRFEAEGVGHPLIPGDRRVTNDVSLPDPGRALLITGSNMSGKSTLMRAMGLAAVMALAGAPVCARRLRLSELDVQTSMRVSDSLEQGVSHFYAEISKLKRVLSAAEAGHPVFFLLDEILHGTNSQERQIGARWVLARLLELSAVGAVSTHDIELCRLDAPLMDQVDQFHFRETVENGAMRFDYALRPGSVSGGNALRLMRQLGIEVPIPDEPR